MLSIEILWGYACSGNTEKLKEYYEEKNNPINRRFTSYNKEHSLLMGAYNNCMFDTMDYLLSVGETLTPEEQNIINIELRRIEMLQKLSNQ